MDKHYRQRIVGSFVATVAFHAVVFVVYAHWPDPPITLARSNTPNPIEFRLRPPDAPQRLIDANVPATDKVDPNTDFIAEIDANAASMTESNGKRLAPSLETPSDFDALGAPETPAVKTAPAKTDPKPQRPPSPKGTEQPKTQEEPLRVASVPAMKTRATQPMEPQPQQEPLKTAQAKKPTEPAPNPGVTVARADGGAKAKGFIGFEAKQHEFAPYMNIIREGVERRWRAAMQLKYSGATTEKAVMDCEISPDGKVVRVEIINAGESSTYAALCKEAIERAGPFPPFPFDVPPVYRNRNLEIRWTFSFL